MAEEGPGTRNQGDLLKDTEGRGSSVTNTSLSMFWRTGIRSEHSIVTLSDVNILVEGVLREIKDTPNLPHGF
jgi:hypothetical protein